MTLWKRYEKSGQQKQFGQLNLKASKVEKNLSVQNFKDGVVAAHCSKEIQTLVLQNKF